MRNIRTTVKGNKLILEVDLSEVVDESSRGNDIICGTNNWEEIETSNKEASFSMRMVIVKRAKKQRKEGGNGTK